MKNAFISMIILTAISSCGGNKKPTLEIDFVNITNQNEKNKAESLISLVYESLFFCDSFEKNLPENYKKLVSLGDTLKVSLQEGVSSNCVDNILSSNLLFINISCNPSEKDVAFNLLDMTEKKQSDDEAVNYVAVCGF
jgi:hypothetical protein